MDPNTVHYWAREGTSSVYRHYLEEADVEELRCNTRVSTLETSGNGLVVTGMRGEVSDPHAPFNVRHQIREAFDAVVLAMPHHDVMRIGGIFDLIGPEVQ